MEEIVSFYNASQEASRLTAGWGLLEWERTCDLLTRHLPPPPARILDMGGGTGIYAEWLGTRGYEAHLIDLVPRHIEQAKERCHHVASFRTGDARQIPDSDGSYDAVLLFGPLYHLTDREDRLRAIAEANRVLKPGGLILATAISRWAPLLHSMLLGFHDDPAFKPVLSRDLEDGQHRNTTGDPRRFTTAYFHRPEEFKAELESPGGAHAEIYAVEGAAWLAWGDQGKFAEHWGDESRRLELLDLLRRTEREPALLSVSQHWLGVVRRDR